MVSQTATPTTPVVRGWTPMSCISKDLYETAPQSRIFFIRWIYEVLHNVLILVSKFRLGQFLISYFDSYMLKFEKTLDFCVPKHPTNEAIMQDHAETLPEHDRPMTWLLFIPALIMLRIFRFWLSVFSILMCRGGVSARDLQLMILHFRRYYRSVRHYAVDAFTKEDWQRRDERVRESTIWAILYKLYELVFMTKPLIEHHPDKIVPFSQTTPQIIASTSRTLLQTPDIQQVLREITRRSIRRAAAENSTPTRTSPTKGQSDETPSTTSKRTSVSSTADEEVYMNGNNGEHHEEATRNGFESPTADQVTPTIEITEDVEESKQNGGLTDEEMMELENQIFDRLMSYYRNDDNIPPIDEPAAAQTVS